jgi:hypothetical protein
MCTIKKDVENTYCKKHICKNENKKINKYLRVVVSKGEKYFQKCKINILV